MKNKSKKSNLDKINYIRNLVSCICASLIIIFTICGVVYGLLEKPNEITPERGVFIFHLFTVNSNLLSLVASILIVSFTIQGFLKKRYEVPNRAFQVLYCATICVFLTFVFSLCLIFPRNGISALIGMNLFLHLLCPALCVLLFYFVSCDKKINLLNSFLVLIPFALYALAYAIMVLIVKEENGGWRDIYQLFKYMPRYVTLILIVPVVFGISTLFRFTHNKVVYHRDLAIKSWIISEYKDLDRESLLVNIYNLGFDSLKEKNNKSIVIPLKDLYLISSNNQNASLYEIVNKFNEGYLDHMKQLNEKE